MTQREFLDIVFALVPKEANTIMDAFDEYVESAQLGTNLAQLGTDCISRQTAIDALDKCHCGGKDENGSPWIYKENAVEAIEMVEPLPPAEPKRGRWILDRSGAYCCSECMEPCATYIMGKTRDKFCKMCGAKMEETNE